MLTSTTTTTITYTTVSCSFFVLVFGGICCCTASHFDVSIYDVTRTVVKRQCCDVCLCRSDRIYCSSRDHLSHIPTNISHRTQFLDLSGNHITALPRRALSDLVNLTDVLLGNNQLHAMHNQAFQSLSSLTKLDLSQNQLVNVRLDLSDTAVQNIDLSRNKLDWVLGPDTLYAPTLKHLNLSHNLIKAPRLELDPLYLNYTELETLDLSGNVFVTLVTSSLSYLPPSVRTLSLAHCDTIDAEAHVFRTVGQHLHDLDLSGNFLSLNELKAIFANMPNNTVETLRLRNMKLQEVVPDPCFPGWRRLKHIDFSFNHIQIVSDIAFQGTCLETLNLIDNVLRQQTINLTSGNLPHLQTLLLDGNAFDQIPALDLISLHTLHVSRNRLQNINVDALHCKNLTSFIVSRNQIRDFDLHMFIDYQHLNFIDVSYNLLTSFNLSSAVGRRLTALKLDHNDISVFILDDSLRPFHLELLDIGWNNFSSISDTLFRRLPKLQTLVLSGNRALFHPQSSTLLANIRSLDRLEASDSKISALNFRELCVKHLVLKHNAFTYVSGVELMLRRSCLQTLDLRSNFISAINSSFLRTLPSLESVSFSDNPLSCDCALRELHQWVRHTHVRIDDYADKYVCSAPPQLQDSTFWSIEEKLQNDCGAWQQHGLYLTGALAAVVLSVVLVTLFVARDALFRCKRRRLLSTAFYISCSEKVKKWRKAKDDDYPHLFTPPSAGGGYHHLDLATDTPC